MWPDPCNDRPRVMTGIVLAAMLSIAACSASDSPPATKDAAALTVFAAASATDVLNTLARDYEQHTGRKVTVNVAASSLLAKQIEHGARADVFLSADPQWMDYLAARDLIDVGSRVDLLANRLVMIAPCGGLFVVRFDPEFDVAAAIGGRLALGDPTHVPAGRYARAALEQLGWWRGLEPTIVPAMDVRAALAYVELGEVAAGIVYATDAAASKKVEIVGVFPPDCQPRIVYPAALCRDAAEGAAALLDYLGGQVAGARFRDAGFATLASGKR